MFLIVNLIILKVHDFYWEIVIVHLDFLVGGFDVGCFKRWLSDEESVSA